MTMASDNFASNSLRSARQGLRDEGSLDNGLYGSSGEFPASALNTPMFEALDIAGLVGGIIITLGPLAAYSLGWGA